jgi:CheY-like chemotaxis protein
MKEPKKKVTPDRDKCDLLIVDDEESISYFLGESIRKRIPNIRIQSAEDGLKGLEKAKAFRPRIVWTGVRMPRMDGLEMIERIRQVPDLQNTKIIICTGCYRMEDVKTRARELGVDKFLPKPFNVEEALSVIAGWVRNETD